MASSTCMALATRAALLLLACIAPSGVAFALPSARVAIVQSSDVPPFHTAATALSDSLRQRRVQPEILTFDLAGDAANADSIFAAVEAAEPTIIVTIGTLATDLALLRDSSTPLVFSMVLYPEQSGFLKSRPRRVAGVSLDISADSQFSTLRQLLPKARRVGVLHSPEETGLVIAAARAGATTHGFELQTRTVASPADAMAAMADLLPNVDVVWSVADSHVFTAQTTPALILSTLRASVPMVGISPGHARAGAVLAMYADYADIGRQTAEQVELLLEGTATANPSVVAPRKVLVALNGRSAAHIGLTLPPELTRIATEVIE